MTAQPAPTPYRAEFNDAITIHEANGWRIAMLSNLNIHGRRDTNEVEATAKFIVTACNAHDQLVAALSTLVKYLSDTDDEGLIEHAQPMMAARAALALAGAK